LLDSYAAGARPVARTPTLKVLKTQSAG